MRHAFRVLSTVDLLLLFDKHGNAKEICGTPAIFKRWGIQSDLRKAEACL